MAKRREHINDQYPLLQDEEIMRRVIWHQEEAGLCDSALCKIAGIDLTNYCNRKKKWSCSTVLHINKICKVLWLSYDYLMFDQKYEIEKLTILMEKCPPIEQKYFYDVLRYYLMIYHQNDTYLNNSLMQIKEQLLQSKTQWEEEKNSIVCQGNFRLKKYMTIEKSIEKYTLKDILLACQIYGISVESLFQLKDDTAFIIHLYQSLPYIPIQHILTRYLTSYVTRTHVPVPSSNLKEFNTISLVAMGKRIRQRRLELGIVIEKAAEMCHVSINTWSRIEHGKNNIILRTLSSIARAFSMSANEIVWGPIISSEDWDHVMENSSQAQREFFYLIQNILSHSQ